MKNHMTKINFRIHSSLNNQSKKSSKNRRKPSQSNVRTVHQTLQIFSLVRHHLIHLDVLSVHQSHLTKRCRSPKSQSTADDTAHQAHSFPLKSSRQLKTCKMIKNSTLQSPCRKNLFSFQLYSDNEYQGCSDESCPDCPSYSSPEFKYCLLCLFYRKAFPCTTPKKPIYAHLVVIVRNPKTKRSMDT